MVVQIFLKPTLFCVESCGSKVLELLYCDECGDETVGGYVIEEEAENDNLESEKIFLSTSPQSSFDEGSN